GLIWCSNSQAMRGSSQLLYRSSLLFLAVAGCASADAKTAAPSEAAARPLETEVAVVTLRTESIALQTELAGRTAAYRTAEVRPQVTGIIQERLFREGSNVAAGQVLYAIDAAVYRATHERVQAELASSEAN